MPPGVEHAHEEYVPAHMDGVNDDTHFSFATDLTLLTIPPSASGLSTSTSNPNSINRGLLELWSNEYDLDYVYNLPPCLSTHLNLGISPASDAPRHPATVREMLKLPKPESNLVLIARSLLMLGSILQGALSQPDVDAQRRGRFEQLMLSIMNTATKSVTTGEKLISSIEGLECTMLEAMIQNHAGNLHQAWRTLRRAMTIAQTLGLQQDTPLQPKLFLDPENHMALDVEHFCFQVICMDRYLSLTLGFPHASYLPYATTSEQLMAFDPIDRMARQQCVIADRLLERSRKDTNEHRDIDSMLLEATAQTPHHWWLIPEPDIILSIKQDQCDTVARFTFQLSHYHLLLLLYMPCVLGPLSEAIHAHGRRVALSVSRKILSCFLAFRKWNSSAYYCSGLDFLALIALIVLCVSHIDSRRFGGNTSIELAHCYATDRAMMQQILGIMQWTKYDELVSQLVRMMQSLLDIEAETANGTEYSATAVYSSEVATEYQSDLLDEGRKLQLRIPYFGTIVLQRMPGPAPNNASIAAGGFVLATQDAFENGVDYDVDWSQQAATCEDWTLLNVNQALFLDLFGNV